MAQRDEIIRFANELLEIDRFPEYGTPGLQVLGADEVTKIACGVSSSKELFERAAAAGAQLVIVHHGMFWRNEPVWIDRRQRGRLEALFAANLSLAAYHLALDAHPELGNNALLAEALGVDVERPFAEVGQGGTLREPIGIEELAARVRATVGREPLVFAHGPDRIERVAICSGGAGRRADPRRPRGLRRLPDRRARRSRACRPRASSGSTSSQPGTTRPSASASRRCRSGSPSSSASTGSSSQVENPV